MRFMILVKATKDSEAGVMPSEGMLTAMEGMARSKSARCSIWRTSAPATPSTAFARWGVGGKK